MSAPPLQVVYMPAYVRALCNLSYLLLFVDEAAKNEIIARSRTHATSHISHTWLTTFVAETFRSSSPHPSFAGFDNNVVVSKSEEGRNVSGILRVRAYSSYSILSRALSCPDAI